MVMSTSTMKVQTTVFVGNISEKASDTLVRQILLVNLKETVAMLLYKVIIHDLPVCVCSAVDR